MQNVKQILVRITLSLALVSTGLLNACSKEKEVKVNEEVNSGTVSGNGNSAVTPPVDDGKNVNVDVNVDNPQQPATQTTTKEETNIVVDKPANTKLNNDMSAVNANLQKLQAQVKTANDQNKAQLNKQIQQMNTDKQKLQQQIAALQVKNQEVQKNMQDARDQMEKARDEYVRLTQVKLDDFNDKLSSLQDKVNNLDDTERTTVDQQVSKLQDLKNSLDQKMSDLETATDTNTYNTLRTQIESMLKNLQKNYNQLITDKVSLR
jgi:chromosome segregation ATPase